MQSYNSDGTCIQSTEIADRTFIDCEMLREEAACVRQCICVLRIHVYSYLNVRPICIQQNSSYLGRLGPGSARNYEIACNNCNIPSNCRTRGNTLAKSPTERWATRPIMRLACTCVLVCSFANHHAHKQTRCYYLQVQICILRARNRSLYRQYRPMVQAEIGKYISIK